MVGVTKIVTICRNEGRGPFFLFLAAIGLAFLQPFQIWPFNNGLEDVGLAALVLVVAGWCVLRRDRLALSWLLVLWLAFGGVLAFSALTVERPFVAPVIGVFAFWFVGLAVIQLGAAYSWVSASDDYARRIAWFLFLLSLISILLALVRFYGIWELLRIYSPDGGSGRLSGLMRQSNTFAVLTLLGGIAFLWLGFTKSWRLWVLVGLAFLYCYSLVLSGTRVIYLIYAGAVLVVLFQAVREKKYGFLAVLLAFGFYFLVVRSFAYALDNELTAYFKALGFMPWTGGSSRDIEFAKDVRLSEWYVAWKVFLEAWPLGVGPGGYAAASYAMHLKLGILPIDSMWHHSHNSYLQLGVEYGVLGVIWTFAMGLLVARVLWRACCLEQPMQAMLILALLIYSFFEFPLWLMSYFVLGLFVLAAGVPFREVVGGRILGLGVLLGGIAVGVFYAWLFSGLIRMYLEEKQAVADNRVIEVVDYRFLNRLVQDPLLEPTALVMLYSVFGVNPNILEVELDELSKMQRYRPSVNINSRYAIALAIAGRRDEAIKVRDDILSAFVSPVHRAIFREKVEAAMRVHDAWDLGFLLEGLPPDDPKPN